MNLDPVKMTARKWSTPKPSPEPADLVILGGAGHVGIPLTLCFAAAGKRVLILDLNERAMDSLLEAQLPFVEHGAEGILEEALRRGRISCTNNPAHIPPGVPVIVTIGTPVDEFLNPVQKAVAACIDGLRPHLREGQLLILRSTVFPGTTDWLSRYLSDQKVKVAFCPERVVQGRGIEELRSMPQIVSGTTPAAEEEAAALFSLIVPKIVRTTPLEAEFAKLFSNVYRYVEFATTNQFFMIAHSAGADYGRILEAMKMDYPRLRHIPGPGFAAGPCLFKDTMQLAAYARNQFALGHAAMLVNEGLVLYVVDWLRREIDLGQATVGLLGMAFKADIDDTRASLSYKLKKTLAMHARRVLTTDPFVTDDPELRDAREVIDQSDALVLCTPHREYKQLDLHGKKLFDVWNFVEAAR
jgi:UDP-N-acetyl-D-mannosaminuronic acid dehydrogenase